MPVTVDQPIGFVPREGYGHEPARPAFNVIPVIRGRQKVHRRSKLKLSLIPEGSKCCGTRELVTKLDKTIALSE